MYTPSQKSPSLAPMDVARIKNKKILPNAIRYDPDGNEVPGLQVGINGWDARSQQPLPFYLTTEDHWLPIFIDHGNRLVHGFVKDFKTGQVKPVGIQAVDSQGCCIPDMIVGPDGRKTSGVPLSVSDGDHVDYSGAFPSFRFTGRTF